MPVSISPRSFAAFALMGATLGAAYAVGGDDVAEFQSLVPVDEAGLAPGTLRGVPGASFPWTLEGGEARVADDQVEVAVRGLAVDQPHHPADGTNPMTRVFVTVSCLDQATGDVVNQHTAPVPATEAGAADITETFDPAPRGSCVAPIVILRGDLSTLDGGPPGNPDGPDPRDPWIAAGGSP